MNAPAASSRRKSSGVTRVTRLSRLSRLITAPISGWRHRITPGGRWLVAAAALAGAGTTVSVLIPFYQIFCALAAVLAVVEIVGVLVAAADRKHASAEHIDKAVHDPRRVAPIREHPGQLVGQTETPLGHRQKHHAPIRGQATAIEGSCNFLGVNGWK